MKKLLITAIVLLCGTAMAQNHWVPNSAPYEDYMAMIVVLQLDGEEVASTGYEIGAFCGDECRGSAVASFFPPTQRYVYQLPVYGNIGDAITFRLYDREQGMEMDGYECDGVTYVAEGYGSLGNPYVMSFAGGTPPAPPTGLVITLTPGWNWISYLLLTETPVGEALVHLAAGEGDMLKGQGGFCTYNATTHQWSGNLNKMIPGQGYMYMNNSTQNKTFYYPE